MLHLLHRPKDSDPSEGLVYSVLEPSSYVFERNLQIKLHKLSADDIAHWTKSPRDASTTTKGYRLRARKSRASRTGISLRNSKVVNYRPMLIVSKKDVPSAKPGTIRCSKRPRPNGPSSSRIQANKLILKAKLFTTKPVTNKYPAPDPNSETSSVTVPVETPSPPADSEVHVETYDGSTDEYETSELPVVTGNDTPSGVSTVPTGNGKPKRKQGQVSIKSYVLKKKKKLHVQHIVNFLFVSFLALVYVPLMSTIGRIMEYSFALCVTKVLIHKHH